MPLLAASQRARDRRRRFNRAPTLTPVESAHPPPPPLGSRFAPASRALYPHAGRRPPSPPTNDDPDVAHPDSSPPPPPPPLPVLVSWFLLYANRSAPTPGWRFAPYLRPPGRVNPPPGGVRLRVASFPIRRPPNSASFSPKVGERKWGGERERERERERETPVHPSSVSPPDVFLMLTLARDNIPQFPLASSGGGGRGAVKYEGIPSVPR